MFNNEIKDYKNIIDYTLLSPLATEKDILRLINIAVKNKYFAVCVHPMHVKTARKYIDEKFPDKLKLCAVVGFPLGMNITHIKVAEAKECIVDGADELDVVINLSWVKEDKMSELKSEIGRLVRTARKRVIKVIVETSALTRDEIVKVCRLCVRCKVDFVKTSTGFGTGGATPEVVELIAREVRGKCGIKASGGISSREQALDLMRAGATRIGTSKEI